MSRVIVVGEMEEPDPTLLRIIGEVSSDCWYCHIDELVQVVASDDVIVPLGKKCVEEVLGFKIKMDKEIGQQHDATVGVCPVKVICQYHPTYVQTMGEKKGGASEKALRAWFDVWDTVQEVATGEESPIPDVEVVWDFDELVVKLDFLLNRPTLVFGYDYETYGENSRGENLALRPELCRLFYILTIGVGYFDDDGVEQAFAFKFQWLNDPWPREQFEEIKDRWLRLLERESKVAHFAKYEHKCNIRVFGRTTPSMCTFLMDDTLNELNDHGLHRVGARCGLRWMRYKSQSDGIRKNPKDADLGKLLTYNALDGLCTILSYDWLQKQLEEEEQDGNARLEEEFCLYLARMETTGVQIDPVEANAIRSEIEAEIPKMEARFQTLPEVKAVCKWALRGGIKKFQTKAYQNGDKRVEFSAKSPPMMQRLILHELKLPIPKVKDKGKEKIKLDKRALEPFEEDVPVLRELVGLRKLSAMKTGFLDKWEAFVDDLGRVHSQYNQGKVVTGRLSSTDPPQQNIPKKHKVRRVYVSRWPDGWLVNADVKQQEPRLLAGWSGDEKMIEAINSGYDLHGFVASEIYQVEYQGDATQNREIGKRMNLGMMYGQTEYGLSAKTGMTVEAALRLLKTYDVRFPKIAKQRVEWQRFAALHGYAEDLFRRRRHLPDAKSPDKWVRERALRQASNYPIQRTAMVFTMISLCVAMQEIENQGWQDAMCVMMTVHDSIVGDSADRVYRDRLCEIMQYGVECHNTADYWRDKGVPMLADVETGRNFYELHDVDELEEGQ
jgi:DNA polymerase I-like protein with 3'-5' exonuclease and polymerase domains